MRVTDTHIYFWDGIYSNWHPAKFVESHWGITFENTEQGFMFFKAMHFNDNATCVKIRKTPNPKEVKALGRLVKGYDESEWARVRYQIMLNLNQDKFDQIEEYKQELLATGDKIIVEASPYDVVWGVGLGEDDPLILDEKNWKGQNLLGKVCMEVRTNLRKYEH
jgi:ribA/ribD-fused uncharacterized protein